MTPTPRTRPSAGVWQPAVWNCIGGMLAVVVLAAGCGGPANKYDAVVTGTVTIEGDLADSGTIAFHPVEKGGKPAIGRIYPDGSFSMRTGQGDLSESDGGTVEPGEYIVTVSITGPPREDAVLGEGGPPVAGPLLIHERYTRRETSDLKKTVNAGDNVFVFDLEAATPVADDEESSDETDETNADVAEPEDEQVEEAEADIDEPPVAAPADQQPVEGASP